MCNINAKHMLENVYITCRTMWNILLTLELLMQFMTVYLGKGRIGICRGL
jgi:hypothetical protein